MDMLIGEKQHILFIQQGHLFIIIKTAIHMVVSYNLKTQENIKTMKNMHKKKKQNIC